MARAPLPGPAVLPPLRRQCRSAATAKLAHILGSFLRTLAVPDEVPQWSMTTLRQRLAKIGARIVRHGRSIINQIAEVMVSRRLFRQIRATIAALRSTQAARC